MKALSLWQPWASLVALGVKTIETRSWATSYRGPLAIHAAKREPDLEMLEDGPGGQLYDERSDATDPVVAQWDRGQPRDYFPNAVPPPDQRWSLYVGPDFAWHPMPLGAVVATCELAACIPTESVVWCPAGGLSGGRHWGSGDNCAAVIDAERPYGDYSEGRFAWLFNDIKPVDPPVPARGRQQLWEWTP